MPRLVRLEATGPIKIDPAMLDPAKPIFICACGLSQKFPFCDGSHKPCRDHDPTVLYVYDAQRRVVVETRPEPPAPAGPRAAGPHAGPDAGPGPGVGAP